MQLLAVKVVVVVGVEEEAATSPMTTVASVLEFNDYHPFNEATALQVSLRHEENAELARKLLHLMEHQHILSVAYVSAVDIIDQTLSR